MELAVAARADDQDVVEKLTAEPLVGQMVCG
jgi:hypothetical protein